MAYSAYTRALNHLINGNESKARIELGKLKKMWGETGISIDIDESIQKMHAEIKRLTEQGLIESSLPISRNDLARNPYVDNEYQSTTRSKPINREATGIPKSHSAPELHNLVHDDLNFEYDKDTKLGNGTLSFNDFTDSDIYEGATKLPISDIESGKIVINYNNIAYGGYAPNLQINFKSPLSLMHNSKTRVNAFDGYLQTNGIDIQNIRDLTPIELVKQIAKHINNDSSLSLEDKEAKLEKVTRRITQMMLNETDVSNDYMLSTNEKIRGRNYGHVGLAGGLVNSLFSNVAMHDNKNMNGTISTNTLIKAGTADCRATNATFASLLNVGYEAIASEKQAKILYTKMAHGTNKDNFAKCSPEDHNVVVVKDKNDKVTILDAYFEHVNGTSLRDAIKGTASAGSLKKDENEVGGSRTWAFQIPGAPPYPSQQQIKALSSTLTTTPAKKDAVTPISTIENKENAHPSINVSGSTNRKAFLPEYKQRSTVSCIAKEVEQEAVPKKKTGPKSAF